MKLVERTGMWMAKSGWPEPNQPVLKCVNHLHLLNEWLTPH